MSVVINQFEVVPGPEPAAERRERAPAPEEPPAPPSPRDVERAVRHLALRAARVRAH